MILSIVNQKGGVGKTTTAVNLAAALAKRKQKVLLLDLDPQGNATSGFGIDKNAQERTSYDILINQQPIQDVVIKDVRKNLDICPANINLVGAEVEMVEIVSRETILQKALAEIREQYDLIIVDCPPSLGLLTVNALTASDGVLIPIQAEYYALEGLTQLIETIQMIRAELNVNLTIFGVLITMFDVRTQLSHQVSNEVRQFFKDQVFKSIIPRNVRLSESPSYGKPINEHDRWSKGARSYDSLSKEVIARVEGLKSQSSSQAK